MKLANSKLFRSSSRSKSSMRNDIETMNHKGQIEAMNRSFAVIEFELDGTIITANENFLHVMGYELSEVVGKHHSLFVDSTTKVSGEYTKFWEQLNKGEFQAKEFKRLGKNQKEVWIQASYNPIFDKDGIPFKVVKYATDITKQKQLNADFNGQIEAIKKSQAVIEFNMDGTVITANDNFLQTLGYSLQEISGKHHSMFVEPSLTRSSEYKTFWDNLKQGKYQAGEFQRIGKGGKSVWIQASYNPIFNLNGQPYKIVKYASDITEQKLRNQETENVLKETSAVMNAMSQGDLTQRVTGSYRGEFKSLKNSVNSCCDHMNHTIRDIESVAKSVKERSTEIAASNVDLSKRTEKQAANLQETASSMEEMTSTVELNSGNATRANSLVQEVSKQAMNGGSIVTNAVQSMEELNQSSIKIKDIIGVIDNIAFQTNLLALNASVEAARAGDLGRGFAVVASEVRNLAGRSAEAAKEIKNLIEESSDKVESSTKFVHQAGASLTDIVDGVIQVSSLVEEIESSSKEQFEGIKLVNNAVTQMDGLTQQNAALVEEASASSQNLSSQATDMTSLISTFRVDEKLGESDVYVSAA